MKKGWENSLTITQQKDGKKKKTNRKNILCLLSSWKEDFRFGARFEKVERNKLAIKIHIMKSQFLGQKLVVKNSLLKYWICQH